ncbi:MAG: hypothetical protein AAFO07_02645 [Bacteroidota bacterium]
MTAEFIGHIEDYLNGKLSRTELEALAVEQGVENLDEEIEWMENSILSVQLAGLRNQLKEALPKPEQKSAKVRSLNSRRWAIGIAASVLLLVVSYFGFFQTNEAGLYAEFDYVDPGLPVLMSQSEDYLLYDAMSYFGEANYAVAEEKLLQIQDEYDGNDTLVYYLGASQFYQGKIDTAKEQLENIASDENSRFNQRAEWLLVLTALKSNNTNEAQQLLAIVLREPNHEFYQKAVELREKLSE